MRAFVITLAGAIGGAALAVAIVLTLAQNGKLRGRFIAVRSIQRPAQPRQRVQADARLEGRPHEAQPLQGGIIEQAIAARGARHRTQQSAQQVVAHDMHAHPGIKSQPGHRVGVH